MRRIKHPIRITGVIKPHNPYKKINNLNKSYVTSVKNLVIYQIIAIIKKVILIKIVHCYKKNQNKLFAINVKNPVTFRIIAPTKMLIVIKAINHFNKIINLHKGKK